MVIHTQKKEITFLEICQLVTYEAQTDVSMLVHTNTETKTLIEIFVIYTKRGSVKYAIGGYLRQ